MENVWGDGSVECVYWNICYFINMCRFCVCNKNNSDNNKKNIVSVFEFYFSSFTILIDSGSSKWYSPAFVSIIDGSKIMQRT